MVMFSIFAMQRDVVIMVALEAVLVNNIWYLSLWSLGLSAANNVNWGMPACNFAHTCQFRHVVINGLDGDPVKGLNKGSWLSRVIFPRKKSLGCY